MRAPVTLERYVGPALYVHGQGDVIVHEGSFAAGMVIPCHVHAEPVISLVLEGDGVEEVGGRTRLVTAQDLLLTPAYALHGYRFSRSGRWFNMQVTDGWLARVADGGAILPDAAQIIHSHAATCCARFAAIMGRRSPITSGDAASSGHGWRSRTAIGRCRRSRSTPDSRTSRTSHASSGGPSARRRGSTPARSAAAERHRTTQPASALAGDTRIARHDGMHTATTDTTSSPAATTASVVRSPGATP